MTRGRRSCSSEHYFFCTRLSDHPSKNPFPATNVYWGCSMWARDQLPCHIRSREFSLEEFSVPPPFRSCSAPCSSPRVMISLHRCRRSPATQAMTPSLRARPIAPRGPLLAKEGGGGKADGGLRAHGQRADRGRQKSPTRPLPGLTIRAFGDQ